MYRTSFFIIFVEDPQREEWEMSASGPSNVLRACSPKEAADRRVEEGE